MKNITRNRNKLGEPFIFDYKLIIFVGLCGAVVSVTGSYVRGRGFDVRTSQTFRVYKHECLS